MPLIPNTASRDIIAGITLATLAIPEAMGYSLIAGMPVITGLFTLLLPMVLFSLFGSSKHLVVGADSATAAMMAAGLATITTVGSATYTSLAVFLALMAAAFLLLARLFRLGFLANFLSRTVLIGFLTGVGVQVALGQIPVMLGFPADRQVSAIQHLISCWESSPKSVLPLFLSLLVIAAMTLSKTFSKVIPMPLIVIVMATTASWAFDFSGQGVAVLGPIPAGLPMLTIPQVSSDWPELEQLIPIAFGMFIVILAQSAATSRAYADRYDEPLDENRDIIGLCLANIGTALSGSFVVNGSPTKTQMVDSAGGRSQLAHLTAAVIVIFVLLFVTGPLAYMPKAVLASIVFLIGIAMIDIAGMKQIYHERPAEFGIAGITTSIVVIWGVEQGILLSIMLSLIMHTRHGYQPKNSLIKMTATGRWQACPVSTREQLLPGLLVYRFNHSLYYANRTQLAHETQSLLAQANPPLKWFCLDCIAIDDIDYSAAQTLRRLTEKLAERNIHLLLLAVSDDVRKELKRSELLALNGGIDCYDALEDVVKAYRDECQTEN